MVQLYLLSLQQLRAYAVSYLALFLFGPGRASTPLEAFVDFMIADPAEMGSLCVRVDGEGRFSLRAVGIERIEAHAQQLETDPEDRSAGRLLGEYGLDDLPAAIERVVEVVWSPPADYRLAGRLGTRYAAWTVAGSPEG